MTITATKFTMNSADIFAVQAKAANITNDPFGSPVYQLRMLLGV